MMSTDNQEDHLDTYKTHQIPITGWHREIPSQKGGTYEKDYMHKPPYEWESEGERFRAKYNSYAPAVAVVVLWPHQRT